jgi:hypothetical protein
LISAASIIRLRDGLVFPNRKRAVFIGELLETGLDEGFPRHGAHRFQHTSIAHAPPRDLDLDHPVPCMGEIGHESYRSLVPGKIEQLAIGLSRVDEPLIPCSRTTLMRLDPSSFRARHRS